MQRSIEKLSEKKAAVVLSPEATMSDHVRHSASLKPKRKNVKCEILTYYFQRLEREGLENEVLGHFRIFSRNLGPPWYTC